MDSLPPPLSGVYYIWSLLLLPSSFVLNLSAFLLLLRSAGTCYKDPIVPPLLSVLGEIYWFCFVMTSPVFQAAISSMVSWFRYSLFSSRAQAASCLVISYAKLYK